MACPWVNKHGVATLFVHKVSGVWCLVSAVPGTDSTGCTGYGYPSRAGLDGATPRWAQRPSRRSRLLLPRPHPRPTPPASPPPRSGATRPPPRGGRRSGLVGPPHGVVAVAHPGSQHCMHDRHCTRGRDSFRQLFPARVLGPLSSTTPRLCRLVDKPARRCTRRALGGRDGRAKEAEVAAAVHGTEATATGPG